jgi:hypothetical protein
LKLNLHHFSQIKSHKRLQNSRTGVKKAPDPGSGSATLMKDSLPKKAVLRKVFVVQVVETLIVSRVTAEKLKSHIL